MIDIYDQYFTKIKRISENRGARAYARAPLFSGFSQSFRNLLIIHIGKGSVQHG